MRDVGVSGQMGAGKALPAGLSDTMTSAMVGHFAREFTQGSLSLWPQFIESARQYFNVTHGYVLRKALWQLVPLPSEKSRDGEITADKDWTARVLHGLEVQIEVPDAYIPTMGFVTYVILYCLIQGLQDHFHPDMLSSTLTFAVVVLILETTAAKVALFVVGAVDAPVVDLVALLGYKYFHLSVQLIVGIVIGGGWNPSGALYSLLAWGLAISCGVALWQVLQRLPRMQPSGSSQECVNDMHKIVIKALPVLQVVAYWCLLPSWAKRPANATAGLPSTAVATSIITTLAAVLGNATGVLPAAAASSGAA